MKHLSVRVIQCVCHAGYPAEAANQNVTRSFSSWINTWKSITETDDDCPSVLITLALFGVSKS